jgi:hypothetical protein
VGVHHPAVHSGVDDERRVEGLLEGRA